GAAGAGATSVRARFQSCSTIMRLMKFSSSRMLPGQPWPRNACMVSALSSRSGTLKTREERGAELARGPGEAARDALHEVRDEAGDLLDALAQRRHQDVDDVEPVEQVLAE